MNNKINLDTSRINCYTEIYNEISNSIFYSSDWFPVHKIEDKIAKLWLEYKENARNDVS